MIILGITGAIGHGKSTIAEILTKLEPRSKTLETSEVISEVASQLCEFFDQSNFKLEDPTYINNWLSHLPDILSDTLNRPIDPRLFMLETSVIGSRNAEYAKLWEFLQWASNNPQKIHKTITQKNKAEFRPLLQWIGGFCVENIQPTFWNEELIKRALKAESEGYSLAILGGIRFNAEAINVRQKGGLILEVIRPSIKNQDMQDPTERRRSQIKPDITVVNDGTLDELSAKVDQLYMKIKKGT